MDKVVRIPTIEELEIINKYFAKKELTAEEIYVFDVKAAETDKLTQHWSYLGKDMIEGFHADIQRRHENSETEIVGYLFGHDKTKIPSGTLFQSVVSSMGDGENPPVAFKPSVYMLKNLNVSGLNTDDYIRAVEAGHTEAVSVGFQAGSFICNLCNQDIRTMTCIHIPGRFYNMAAEGESPVVKRCTYTVHQGFVKERNLVELSGVYAGAMPGARIQSEFTVPENAQVKDGKVIDEKGSVLMSDNIKDFSKNDILRFNYDFDGSIERVGSVESEEESTRDLSGTVEALAADMATLQKAKDELIVLKDTLEATLEDLRANDELLRKNLGLSEIDKIELQGKLGKAEKRVSVLEAENKELKAIKDAYVADLRGKCKHLSVAINGENHSDELFDKEIGVLSIDELKEKIGLQQKQLAQIIPPERKTKVQEIVRIETGSPNAIDKSRVVNQKSELFKTS